MSWYLNTRLYFSEDARVQQIKTNISGVIPVILRCFLRWSGPNALPRIG